MRSRDWLIKQGLAKKGRGRLSLAAKEALAKAMSEGMQFDDIRTAVAQPKEIVVARRKVQAEIVETKPIRTRKESTIYVVDRASKVGQSDLIIAFDICYGCNKPIGYCTHAIPKVPKWISSEEIYFEKPVVA